MNTSLTPFSEPAELLDQTMLNLHELARHCSTSPQWVIEHVQTGIIGYDNGGSPAAISHEQWRFSSQSLVRARRIAQLEHNFEADPQLAAMTADLIEEVQLLRRKLLNLQR